MLFIRMSPSPNTTVGRTTAHDSFESKMACSTRSLPSKYGNRFSDPSSGFVTEMCTIRRTSASSAARIRAREFRTPSSKVRRPRSNLIQ